MRTCLMLKKDRSIEMYFWARIFLMMIDSEGLWNRFRWNLLSVLLFDSLCFSLLSGWFWGCTISPIALFCFIVIRRKAFSICRSYCGPDMLFAWVAAQPGPRDQQSSSKNTRQYQTAQTAIESFRRWNQDPKWKGPFIMSALAGASLSVLAQEDKPTHARY